MKKVSAAISSTLIYLTVVAPAYAELNINPCPSGSSFDPLCNKSVGSQSVIQTIIAILLLVAVLLALGFLIYGGIRWILSGGDKAKVDAARGTIVGAIIGLVIAFAAYFILNLVTTVFGLGTLTNIKVPTFF